ncbi:hypothetical protein CANFE03_00260 [Ligilactobacillus animalis]
MIANDLLPKGANPPINRIALNIKKANKKLPIYRLYFFSTDNIPLLLLYSDQFFQHTIGGSLLLHVLKKTAKNFKHNEFNINNKT